MIDRYQAHTAASHTMEPQPCHLRAWGTALLFAEGRLRPLLQTVCWTTGCSRKQTGQPGVFKGAESQPLLWAEGRTTPPNYGWRVGQPF